MTEFAYQLMDTDDQEANIKVIGIGGGGGNAVSHMVKKEIKGVEFICANTDTQDLRMTKADIQLQIGINETKGLGSGSKPEIGRASAEEDRERIASVIDGANMLFIAAGLGGGTGTGASPVVAEIAQEKGILTVAVINTPFSLIRTATMNNKITCTKIHINPIKKSPGLSKTVNKSICSPIVATKI